MAPADVDGVCAVAAMAFPDHPEDGACFENRLALHPRGCRVLAGGQGVGGVRGYLIAYPWRLDDAPALNALIDALPEDAETLYLHDLALAPDARGAGHAAAGVEQALAVAREGGWTSVALTAVNEAAPFWTRHGFVERHGPAMARRLAGYGADARYMVRTL